MIPDPYIPEQVVDPEDFIGRCEEIEKFKTFLDFSIRSKPRNIAIIGDWGIGKTALLRKFEDIAIQNDSPSARFDVRKNMSLLEFQQRLLLEVKTALYKSVILNAYLDEKINLGKAAELLGVHRLELQNELREKGVPIRGLSKKDVIAEVEAIREWRNR